MRNISRRLGAAVLAAVVLSPLTACGGERKTAPPPSASPSASSTTTPDLGSYTDTGDGCQQAISAIAYADDVLRALGQEPYQEFNDVVRSRIAAVSGTLSLEAKDWPNAAVHRQAQVVQDLARATAALLPNPSAAAKATRVNELLRYRIEAGKLILFCRDAGVKA